MHRRSSQWRLRQRVSRILCCSARFFKTRCAHGNRCKAWFSDIQSSGSQQQGRRVSPFRVERLFVGFVAAGWARFPGKALPSHLSGIRSSHIYIVDTKPDPTKAKIHKIIEPEEIFRKTGYSRPHTVHCGPEGIYVSTLGGGGKDGTDDRRCIHHGLRDVRSPRALGDRSWSPNPAL